VTVLTALYMFAIQVLGNQQYCGAVAQPIRMQTAASKVELAVLHVIEAEPSSADMGAMCERNPLHSFMFDAHGKLLNANKATFEAFQSCPPGIILPL